MFAASEQLEPSENLGMLLSKGENDYILGFRKFLDFIIFGGSLPLASMANSSLSSLELIPVEQSTYKDQDA